METKKNYTKPRVEWIPLDNCISLALESSPPAGPSETLLNNPEHYNPDSFKQTIDC
jgi:hypothetical protein